MSYIIAKVAEKIGTITLNDERHRNALSKHLVEQAISALQSFRETKVRVVIVRARGGCQGVFCGPRCIRAAGGAARPARLG